jgi:hypothetical protein
MTTAVEWIEGYLKKFNHIQESLSLRKAFEQAKEMEKEQIMNAHYEGSENYRRQYYNETFKSK